MNKNELETIITNTTALSLDVGFANQILISCLVKYLADKKHLLKKSLRHTEKILKNLNN
ncbi:MAG: hypothetical protein Q4G13_00330 [Moraxella sp.]|nr:hypothetical protein [Moraxella sp.]